MAEQFTIIYLSLKTESIHRINKNALQRPKNIAGLALPNLMYYYWACNLKKNPCTGGKEMSQAGMTSGWKWKISSSPFNLFSMLCLCPPPLVNMFQSNPVVYHSIRIWSQFRRHLKIQTTFTLGVTDLFETESNFNFKGT